MNWWQQALLVGTGGFAGSVARFATGQLLTRVGLAGFPWGTLTVNVLGCFAIGCVGGGAVPPADGRRLLLMVGVLGGFTTFSAFGLETMDLLHRNLAGRAALNVTLNVVLGLAAAALGMYLAKNP